MINKKNLHKIFTYIEKLSWVVYISAFFYFLLLNSNLIKRNIFVDMKNLGVPFELDDSIIPDTFNFFEIRSRKTSNRMFIQKTFMKFGLDFTETKISSKSILHGIYRAPRSDRKQSVVVAFKYDPIKTKFKHKSDQKSVPSGASVVLNFIQYLQTVKWLAKDVIFVAIPEQSSNTSDYNLLSKWVEIYYGQTDTPSKEPFHRAGMILSAVVIDAPCRNNYNEFIVKAGTRLGILPNMDIISMSCLFLTKENKLLKTFPISEKEINFLYYFEKLIKPIDFMISWQFKSVFESLKGMINFYLFQGLSFDDFIGVDGAFSEKGITSLTIKGVKLSKNVMEENNNQIDLTLFRFLNHFVRSMSNTHQRLNFAFSQYTFLPDGQFIPFIYPTIGLILFLTPNILFFLKTVTFPYSVESTIRALTISISLIMTGFMIWSLPLLIRYRTSINLTVVIVLTGICVVLISKKIFRKDELNLICAFMFAMISLILIPLSIMNFSCALVNAICITPFILIRSSKKRGIVFLLVTETIYFTLLVKLVLVLDGLNFEWVKQVFENFYLNEGCRNLNYFCFFVCFCPVLMLLLMISLGGNEYKIKGE